MTSSEAAGAADVPVESRPGAGPGDETDAEDDDRYLPL